MYIDLFLPVDCVSLVLELPHGISKGSTGRHSQEVVYFNFFPETRTDFLPCKMAKIDCMFYSRHLLYNNAFH